MKGEAPLADLIETACRMFYGVAGPPKADSLPDTILAMKHGLIAVGIPLCGTLTLKRLFLNGPDPIGGSLYRAKASDVRRRYLDPYGEFKRCFTVVRNPWDRAVCCYEKKIRGAKFVKGLRQYSGLATIAAYKGLSTGISFEEFVDWLCNSWGGSDLDANRHWMSQHRFITDVYPGVKVLHLERLNEELNALLEREGVERREIEQANSSQTTAAGRLYERNRDYYTKRTIDLVASRYARDCELFGYHDGPS